MFDFLEYATRLKQKEFLQNAEAQQLIKEALAARDKGQPFYYDALAALGRRMADWGERLQAHYDSARQMPLDLPPLERAHYE
jgi:hypothetical protein